MSVQYGGDKITFADGSTVGSGWSSFKNRIINGAMVIDQRNAGASVTPTAKQYLVDRFYAQLSQASKYTVQQNAGSVTPPVGFNSYLGVTSSSAYSIGSSDYFFIGQSIEGLNVADLGWGTSNAATVTLSFWVRSSLTGTFGGALTNSAFNRSYPFSYTISAANTWEQKTITIAGDQSGTWLKTNGIGINIQFGLGVGSSGSGTAGSWTGSGLWSATGATSVVGTSGATFYITGVQLEKGSTATSFDYRPYGVEDVLCRRYYEKISSSGNSYQYFAPGGGWSSNQAKYYFRVAPKRATPTLSTTAWTNFVDDFGAFSGTISGISMAGGSDGIYNVSITATSATAGRAGMLIANNTTAAYISFDAEL